MLLLSSSFVVVCDLLYPYMFVLCVLIVPFVPLSHILSPPAHASAFFFLRCCLRSVVSIHVRSVRPDRPVRSFEPYPFSSCSCFCFLLPSLLSAICCIHTCSFCAS